MAVDVDPPLYQLAHVLNVCRKTLLVTLIALLVGLGGVPFTDEVVESFVLGREKCLSRNSFGKVVLN